MKKVNDSIGKQAKEQIAHRSGNISCSQTWKISSTTCNNKNEYWSYIDIMSLANTQKVWRNTHKNITSGSISWYNLFLEVLGFELRTSTLLLEPYPSPFCSSYFSNRVSFLHRLAWTAVLLFTAPTLLVWQVITIIPSLLVKMKSYQLFA
jgi:hypothetical protein